MEKWLEDAEMKIFFIFLFVLAFLPLTLACGLGHEGGTSSSVSTNVDGIHEGNIMYDFYEIGFLPFLIMILIIISLGLFILLMIKNLKGGKN